MNTQIQLTDSNTQPDRQHYYRDHLIAKALVCIAVIALGSLGIYTGNSYIGLIPGTLIWFFGVNGLGYLLEGLMHHPHCHNLI